MYKNIIILIAGLLISITAIQAQAGEITLVKDLAIKENTDKKSTLMKSNIDKEFKPYDDVKISEGVSAGFISGDEDNAPTNNKRIKPEEKTKDTRVGMGLSLSF